MLVTLVLVLLDVGGDFRLDRLRQQSLGSFPEQLVQRVPRRPWTFGQALRTFDHRGVPSSREDAIGNRCPVRDDVWANYAIIVGAPVVPLDSDAIVRFISISWEAQNAKRQQLCRSYTLRAVDASTADATETNLIRIPGDFLPEGSEMDGEMCGLIARPVKGKVWGEVLAPEDVEFEFVCEPQG